ncbi:MAG: dihydrofolate reductase, partial [Bacteroidia bacterium]
MNKISLIVARAKDNAIGKDNDLLWKIKDDLRL